MSTIGFDGKERSKPGSWGGWLAATFLISAGYTLAWAYFLPGSFWGTLIPLPFNSGGQLPGALAWRNLPVIAAVLLAFPFRLASRDIGSWVILLFASIFTTGFGTFAAMMAVSHFSQQ